MSLLSRLIKEEEKIIRVITIDLPEIWRQLAAVQIRHLIAVVVVGWRRHAHVQVSAVIGVGAAVAVRQQRLVSWRIILGLTKEEVVRKAAIWHCSQLTSILITAWHGVLVMHIARSLFLLKYRENKSFNLKHIFYNTELL